MANTPQYDVDSYDVITPKIMELLNQYPALASDDAITFSTLDENRGKAMFPLSGGVIENKQTDIWGHVTEICVYPFFVVYRAGNLTAQRRSAVKEWLDDLGRWLERQTIYINVNNVATPYKLNAYPTLQGDRRFISIQRTAPAALNNINDNNTEDWAISITARYRNEYEVNNG